jgi:hypothetical protein
MEKAVAFGAAQIAARQQTRQPRIGCAILWVSQNVRRAIGKDKTRTNGEAPSADFFSIVARINMRTHHTRQRIAIRNANGRKTEFCRTRDHFFRMRSTAQKGEIRGDSKFGVAHANNPCTYHFGRAVSLA